LPQCGSRAETDQKSLFTILNTIMVKALLDNEISK
jgi:hypothetical protein